MKVLIIGKNGNIGNYLSKNLNILQLFTVDKNLLDVTSYQQIKNMLGNINPDIVINCAAFLNADKCEDYPQNSFNVNYKGVVNIVKAINEINKKIKLIHFSSDFVFDGIIERPYKENDLPNPKSVYGLHKYMSEEIIRNFSNNYLILRVASIINLENENNFIRKVLKFYELKKEVEVVSDLKISLTTLTLINEFISYIIEKNIFIKGTYHLCADGVTSWYEIAKFILEKKYYKPINIKKVKHNNFNIKAYRPAFSAMDNSLIKERYDFEINNWKKELEKYYEKFNNDINNN